MFQRHSILLVSSLFLLIVLGSGLLLAFQTAPARDPVSNTNTLGTWPILRHDEGHSGYNPDVGSFRPPLAYLDTIELQTPTTDANAVFNLVTGPDRIYAMGQGAIWGVKKDDPTQQWHNDDCISDPSTRFCLIPYMSYSAGRLVTVRHNIFPTFDYELVILNASTGQEIWDLPIGTTAPEIALEDSSILLLIEEAFSGKLIKLTLNGTQSFKKDADISGFPDGRAVIAGGRFFYANDSRILAYSTVDGQQSWVYDDTARIDTTRGYDLVATTDAVIVSQGERVIKLDATNGSVMWSTDIRPAACSSPLQPHGTATNRSVIAVTSVCDDWVVALDYQTGDIKWDKEIGPVASTSAVAMGGDVLYVASVMTPNFNIFALDPENGAELEKLVRSVTESSSVLVISDGLLLTVSNLGTKEIQRFERMPADLSTFLSPASLPICGASVNATVNFNFQVTNLGPGTTDNTRADLTLPDGVTVISTSQGSCTGGPSPFCELGPLSVGQHVLITATVELSIAGNYAPGISLSGDVRDPNETNNTSIQPFIVNPAAPAGLDLQPTDIEITQGIQNLANEVPLVESKTTFARVYGKTNGDPVNNVSAVLHGQVVGTGDNLGTLTPIPIAECLSMDGDTPDRDQLSESFVFKLPEEWTKDEVMFTAEINPNGLIHEDNTTNNSLSLTRAFTNLPRVCLMTYPVRTTGTRPGQSDETDNLFPNYMSIANDTGNILSRALTMLPVREVKVYPSSHLIEEWEPFSEGGYGPYEMMKSEDNRGDVLDTLWWLNLFTDDPDKCDEDGSRTHYIGMVDQNTTNDVGSAGLGELDGDEAMLFLNTGPNGPQAFDDPHGGFTLAHEVGHNYDRYHVNCGDPENLDNNYPDDRDLCNIAPIDPRSYYGLEFRDPTAPVVITPTMAGDLMSYADDVWPSEYTWEAIQNKLCEANNCTFPSPTSSLASGTDSFFMADDLTVDPIVGDVLVMRGLISDTVTLQNIYRLPVNEVPKANEMWAKQVASRPLTATYALKLISGTTVLHSEPFTPTVSADQETLRTSFGLVVPWDPATTRVVVTVDDQPVISLFTSPTTPTITTLSPNGGESFADTLPISWSASDPDGDELRYTVLYSGDNGASWQALATGVQTTTHTADPSLLPGSTGQSLIKIIATDGLNFASRQSSSGFSLPDKSPLAMIYFPDDDGEYASGSSLTLLGAVYDPEDGYLPTTEMSWTLSGRGFLGTGDHIVLSDLADGEYTLTLSGSDSKDQVGEKSITFRIGQASRIFLPSILRQ